MKKLFLIPAILLLTLTACQKEETVEPTPQPNTPVERRIRILTTNGTIFIDGVDLFTDNVPIYQGSQIEIKCPIQGNLYIQVFDYNSYYEVGEYLISCNSSEQMNEFIVP